MSKPKPKRVWKPLDVAAGFRLYRVEEVFPGKPEWKREYVVAASSPSAAAKLLEKQSQGYEYQEGKRPSYFGGPLVVNQPVEWWENGLPADPLHLEIARREGRKEGAIAALEAIKAAGLLNIILGKPEAKQKVYDFLSAAGVPFKLQEDAKPLRKPCVHFMQQNGVCPYEPGYASCVEMCTIRRRTEKT